MTMHLITAPACLPLPLDVVRAHLKVNFGDDDALISTLIEVATAIIDGRDGYLGRALVEQTWELRQHGFCDDRLRRRWTNRIPLPLSPWRSTLSVKYTDTSGVEQTLATSVYETVDGGGGESHIRLQWGQSWPAHRVQEGAVRIQFTAGYAAHAGNGALDGVIPPPILQGLLLTIGTFYMQRETLVLGQTVVEIPDSAKALFGQYRLNWF